MDSMLTVFQCTTIAGWSYIMYRVMDRVGWTASLYFIVLIIFGAYFVVRNYPYIMVIMIVGT